MADLKKLERIFSKHPKRVVELMQEKQDWMVREGLCEMKDFTRLGRWHLASAEMVISDLLIANEAINRPGDEPGEVECSNAHCETRTGR